MSLTGERLRELVDYDPETGVMRWRVARGNHVSAGDIISSKNTHGYLKAQIDGPRYLVHRLAWLYMYGVWPPISIDHVNGDITDNRIANLRLATAFQQRGNSALRGKNTSGETGVCWRAERRKWRAHIMVAGKQKHLGDFTTKEAAIAARRHAAECAFGEFAAHLSRPEIP